MRFKLLAAVVVVAALGPGRGSAAVKPHALIGEHMVLQQGTKVPLWGSADDGEQVTVRFQGREVSTTARGGRWRVELDGLTPGGPFPLSITGKNSIHLKDVLVGE